MALLDLRWRAASPRRGVKGHPMASDTYSDKPSPWRQPTPSPYIGPSDSRGARVDPIDSPERDAGERAMETPPATNTPGNRKAG
jgi:hypothetical protein